MVLGALIDQFIKNSLKNIAQMPPQLIQMLMTQSSMTKNQLFEMAPSVPANVVALESPNAIENGKRKICVGDGMRLVESKTVEWVRYQLFSRVNLCFGVENVMGAPSLEILVQTESQERSKI